MIHIKLGPIRPAAPDDTMGRDYVGWSPEQSPTQLYERNRGRWKLGARAGVERYVAFTSTTLQKVVLVVEKTTMEDVGDGKWAIVGDILEPGNPVYDGLIGQPSLDRHRNPVTYVDHPLDHVRRCACGCGETVTGTRVFQHGHDQRAVHQRITQQWGGAAGFVTWFDTTYGSPHLITEPDDHADADGTTVQPAEAA